jgi:hypothetical protein
MHWETRPSRLSAFFSSPDRLSPRSSSIYTRSSSPSSTGSHSDFSPTSDNLKPPVVLGICAMDVKARSKAMREILTRLVERSRGGIEVKVFGDKVILDEGTHFTTFIHYVKILLCSRCRKLATMRHPHFILLNRFPTRQSNFLCQAPQSFLYQRSAPPSSSLGSSSRRSCPRPSQGSNPKTPRSLKRWWSKSR